MGAAENFDEALSDSFRSMPVADLKASQADRETLQALLAELEAALRTARVNSQDDALVVARRAKAAVEAAAKSMPQAQVEMKVNMFKMAANNVHNVLPGVLPIATQIAVHLLKLS
jgi:hypothetical protein